MNGPERPKGPLSRHFSTFMNISCHACMTDPSDIFSISPSWTLIGQVIGLIGQLDQVIGHLFISSGHIFILTLRGVGGNVVRSCFG